MIELPIDVTAKGAVLLGKDVACDGFLYEAAARVQTHVHADHMKDFTSSKGAQDILMSRATRDLLVAEYNADLPHRINVIGLDYETPVKVNNSTVELVPSFHMLGSAQVQVTTPDGIRIGYSSDFKWPLDKVVEVDALVLDSTYGSPDYARKYDQATVDERFLDLVMGQLMFRPVVIQGHRGTISRAASVLFGEINAPLVASERVAKELNVYRAYGQPVGMFFEASSLAGRQVTSTNRYIKLVRKGERIAEENCAVITLTAQAGSLFDPVVEFSDRIFEVAMTEHADFLGTLEYVRASKAKLVVTDNSRGGKAIELAMELRNRLGVTARPSSGVFTRAWGA